MPLCIRTIDKISSCQSGSCAIVSTRRSVPKIKEAAIARIERREMEVEKDFPMGVEHDNRSIRQPIVIKKAAHYEPPSATVGAY